MSSHSPSKDIDGLNLEESPLASKENSENVQVSVNKNAYNMEAESYAQALDSIDDEFSSKSSFAMVGHSCHGESSGFVESERILDGETTSASVIFSSKIQEDISKDTNVLDSSVKDSCEVTFNADLLLNNSFVNYERKGMKTSISGTNSIARHENSKDIDSSASFLDDTNTSTMKRNVSAIEGSQQNKKIKTLGSVSSNSVTKINKQLNIKTRKYPPISVRKISRISIAETAKVDPKSKLKIAAGFRKLNSQHSAQCIKQGQIKCDFVCSLYKSKDWATVIELDNCVCNFCKDLFGWEGLTCLNLDKPLPSSFIDPITLLRYYGFVFSFPKHLSSEQNNSSLVNICQKCYDLVLDGDVAYKKLLHIASQMKQLWPKEAIETAIFPPTSEYLNKSFPEYHAKSQDFKQFGGSTSVNETKVNSNRRYPLILPRQESTKSSARQSITSDSFFKPLPKVKKHIEKSKRVRSKPLTCGFCGKDYYLEDQWEQHLEGYHRVQQRWLRFTPNMHNKLRALIINELVKTPEQEKVKSSKGSKSNTFLCSACNNSFSNQTLFIAHLREHHNITIDDTLLPGESRTIQSNRNEREKSKDMSDVQEILGNCYVKEDLHPAESKSKCLMGNDDDVTKVLDLVEYESKNMTDEDSVLNNTLGQITEEAYASKDFVNDEYCWNKNADKKPEINISDENVFCQICSEQFSSKRDLEKHIESTHLTSVVVKGDGKGGVFDFNIDFQSSNISVKKEVDSECPESDVNRVMVDSAWHQDDSDIVESQSFSDDKEGMVKSSDSNMRVPHRLLYECKICSRRITGKKLLYNHLRKIHNISMNLQEEESHYCKFCLFRSTDRALLKEHKREKHGNVKGTSQRQCETCGKIYSSAYIQEHVAIVHGNDRKYTCEFCGMKFFNKKSVKSHIYYEHANKHWKCEKCDLTFKKYHQLRQHTTYVHSNKEFKCEKCSKVFKRKGDLTEHKKRSHQQVTLICNFCSRQYRNAHKFRAHLINVHGVSKEDTYSHQYARHKRANNRLKETVSDVQLDGRIETKQKIELQESQIVMNNTDDVAVDQQLSSSLEHHTASVKNPQEPEFQLVEVTETTNNDMEMEEVTLLIYV